MSHTVSIKTQIKDLEILKRAVKELTKLLKRRVVIIGEGKVEVNFYDGVKRVKNGIAIKIEGWRYPIVIDLDTGEVFYDDYRGRWGNVEDIKKLKQLYAVETVLDIAQKQGVKKGILERLREEAKQQLQKEGKVKLKIPV